MSIHDFDFNVFQDNNVRTSFIEQPNSLDDKAPVIDPMSPGFTANDNCGECNDICVEDNIDINFVEEVKEVFVPGFKLMDRGIKNYFSGIRIPLGKGNEEYILMPVRISGADQDVLVYADKNIRGGRLTLPFLSISRTGENFDPKRYSPPILPVYRHIHCNGKKSESVYRPVPYLIDYSLEIISEHKADAEYALFAIVSKLNPIGSYFLEEKSMGISHEVIIHPRGSTDNSDLESDGSQRTYIKKSITIQMEGWLPVPTKVVPNILTTPVTVREGVQSVSGSKIPGEIYLSHVDRTP